MFVNKKHADRIVEWALANESVVKHRDEIAREKPGCGHVGWENMGYIFNLEQRDKKWVDLGFPFDSLNSIKQDIHKEYNIPLDLDIALMGDILIYTESDYLCKWHDDHNPSNSEKIHTRFNAIISAPESGGMPIFEIDNKKEVWKVEEREVWKGEVGKYKHSTSPMTGNLPRIMLSFGYYI